MFDARGMAIKLTGVPGAKLMDDEKHTQDFVLISHPAFFVDDLKRYRKTLDWFMRGGWVDQYLVSPFQLRWLSETPKAFFANLNFMSNPLHQQYWSMTPYRFGVDPEKKFAVKYTAKPRLHDRPGFFSRHLTRLGWNFSLKEEMNRTLAGNEVWFDFYIQRFVDETSTPIENLKSEVGRRRLKAGTCRQDHHPDPGLHVAGAGRFLRESLVQPVALPARAQAVGPGEPRAQDCLSGNQQAAA